MASLAPQDPALNPLVLTPGPVRLAENLKKILQQELPYNRTEDFSKLTLNIIQNLKFIFQTQGDVVLFTASGTGAMEASVLNFLNQNDRALILNGGTFGKRWIELCQLHKIPYQEYKLQAGCTPSLSELEKIFKKEKITAFLNNAHETSTGILYPLADLGQLTKKYDILHIVDAIGTICCDPYFMDKWHIDVSILSSQKGLALPPGLAFLAMSQKAKEKSLKNQSQTFYFHVPTYLENQKRGQMPFTPAIGLYLLLEKRLDEIASQGLESEIQKHQGRAEIFRQAIQNLAFEVFSQNPSNAITALKCPLGINAKKLVKSLESHYRIYVAPNGGPLEDTVFRVSHMGEQNQNDLKRVVAALGELVSRG